MIEVRNLTKRYGERKAVDDLTFTVEKGRIYGFLGPNGAGKSTTMNIIAGYIAASEGEVSVNGYDILEDAGQAKACIGYLPEQPPLYADMTVDEYLSFAAELKGIKKADRRAAVERAKETVKVSDFSDKLIKNLSKGYRQRVGLAQAIINLPEILILDEPSSGLDPKQIIEMRDLIKELGREHTVILSSHILSEVSAVCDHIMIISKGKLVASDTAENLLRMMKPVTALNLTVKGSGEIIDEEIEEKIIEIFSDIDDIQDMMCVPSSEAIEGGYDLSIQYSSEIDLRSEVFLKLANNGFIILRMESSSATLEDVFMELTADTSADSDTDTGEYAEDGEDTERDTESSEDSGDTACDTEYAEDSGDTERDTEYPKDGGDTDRDAEYPEDSGSDDISAETGDSEDGGDI